MHHRQLDDNTSLYNGTFGSGKTMALMREAKAALEESKTVVMIVLDCRGYLDEFENGMRWRAKEVGLDLDHKNFGYIQLYYPNLVTYVEFIERIADFPDEIDLVLIDGILAPNDKPGERKPHPLETYHQITRQVLTKPRIVYTALTREMPIE